MIAFARLAEGGGGWLLAALACSQVLLWGTAIMISSDLGQMVMSHPRGVGPRRVRRPGPPRPPRHRTGRTRP